MSDPAPEHASQPRARNAVVEYYSEASQDYEAWSPRFNMHFGYWRAGINPFRLESMLDEMTRQAIARLALPDRAVRLLDMGCGLGASARLIGRERPAAHIHGLTIVSWQADHALDLARKEAVAERVRFVQGDYAAAPLSDRSYDGIYAIESACHAAGPDKGELIRKSRACCGPAHGLSLRTASSSTLAPWGRCSAGVTEKSLTIGRWRSSRSLRRS